MNSVQSYSWLDRMVHRVAFSSPAVQLTAADVETSLYGRRFSTLKTDRPIFITSLPRAGTTLMLEVLGGLPGLATYCYRDMPFVRAPLLWERLSRSFRKPASLRERAHADGMHVGYDSPEAFEEILWRALWPEKFREDGIALWSEDEKAIEFRESFVSQMQRIIAVRSNGRAEQRRYLSKNNANIARLGLLRRLFPDAVILVPFRSPIDQAGSLLRQHLRFLQIHRDDPFAREYMDAIGHLEFGELHRPIRFDGIDEMLRRYGGTSIDYWIAYWILGFRHILRYHRDIVLVSYETLCQAGLTGLHTITTRVGIPDETLRDFAGPELRPPHSYHHEGTSPADKDLVDEANALHRHLLSMSIV